MRRLVIVVLGIALLALVPTAGGASPPLAVDFDVPTSDDGSPGGGGPFIATGPAADAGLVCPTGDTTGTFARGSGFQSGVGFNILIVKRFTCDDGSGAFDVKLQVRIDQKGDNFNWVILGGTGAYERLHGTGQGVGVYPDPPAAYDVLDLYSGQLHID